MARNENVTTQFKVDISDLKKSMQDARRQVALANSEFKAVSSSMDDWAKSSEGLKAKINQLKSNLASQKSVLAEYEKTLEAVKREYGENSEQAQEYQTKLNNQKAVVNKTESELKKYESSLETVAEAERLAAENGTEVADELDKLSRAADDAGDSAESASGGFTVMKGALANLVADGIRLAIDALKDFAKAAITTGMDFEASMSEVGAISGASASELELLEKTAKEYGATTVFSASEAAQALKYMALAGWDAEKSSSALGGVLDLAAASGMDLAQASDMVTDYMSAFGMEADKSTYFADMLAFAQSNANTSAEQLGEAYKNSAANLNAAGQDVETVTALLSMMANQGFKGSEAGTALTAIMRDLTAKMKDGKIAIGDTAVTVMDAEGNYRDLTDILKDVEAATNGMGDAERATALSTTFTADSTKGLNLLLNAGISTAEEFEEALRGAGGTAADMGETMTDNLAGDVKEAQSALEDLMITAYDELQPSLREIVQYATENIIPKLKELVPIIRDEIIPAIREAVQFIVDHGQEIMGIITMVVSALAAAKIVGIITTIIGVVQKAGSALALLKVVLAALGGPVTIVIAAIAALVAGFIYLWNTSDKFRQFWINLWEGIKTTVSTVVSAIATFFTETIPEIINNIGEWFSQLPEKIGNALILVIDKIIQWAADMKTKAIETATAFVENVITFVKELPSKIWTWLVNTITKLTEWKDDMGKKGKEAIKELIDKVIDGAKSIPEKMANIGKNIVDGVWQGIQNAKDKFFENVKGFFSGLVDGAKDALGIESPSKVFAKEVGKWIPEGIAVGINANADSALKSLKELSADMVGSARAGLSFGSESSMAGSVVYNFNQTNNSPKALSRLEIYRQSKNLLGYAGGAYV